MASNSIANSTMTTTAASVSWLSVVRMVATSLASLKLTVFLLVLAVFLTWVVTLQQATRDIWELKNEHFSQAFVSVPINAFFPPVWYPDLERDTGIWSFALLFPSGLVIIIAMLVNLTAAHLLRFRLQATGMRLASGLAILVAASVLTWAIIFNYEDAEGFGGQPPIPWETMWKILQGAVLALGLGATYLTITLPKTRSIERILCGVSAVALLAVLGVSVAMGKDAFIGDSAMRILWQLAQSTIAALAILAGCIMLFKRKAGMVLLHLGIVGLLLNELYVTTTNEEHRVVVVEGDKTHHVSDLRETELVVIDRSDPEVDRMTVIPGEIIENTKDQIDDERLPFKIRTVKFFKNSDLLRVGPMVDNPADAGLGVRLNYLAVEKRASAGADANAGVDNASAYVEIIDRKNNASLGTYLVSQWIYPETLDTVVVDGKSYQIGLRFKTVYTPYSIELKDTIAEYYIGTRTPKWFSSEFVIDDQVNGIQSTQKISMNNPLRYRDLTFYQTSYTEDVDPDTPGNQEMSGIQVVRNRGWMIPYVCCMFVVVGLVAQFQQSLISYLGKSGGNKLAAENLKVPDNQIESSQAPAKSNWRKGWVPTVVVLAICSLYYGRELSKAVHPVTTKAKGSEIRLDLLGKMPVTFDGRVQPLDSFARNLARQMCNREEVIDEFGNKQPAIRWLADMMFNSSSANDYQILRIEDVKVQNALGFPKRKGLKFTFSELAESNDTLIKLLTEGAEQNSERQTPFQQRLNEVFRKSIQLLAVKTSFWGTEGRYQEGRILQRLELAAQLADTAFNIEGRSPVMPFAVPTSAGEQAWMPLSIAIEHLWLHELAERYQVDSIPSLAKAILDNESALKNELVKKRVISELLKYEEIVNVIKAQSGVDTNEQAAQALLERWDDIPRELYEKESNSAARAIEFGLTRLISDTRFNIDELGFDADVVRNLSGLKAAYNSGDAKTFNTILQKHHEKLEEISPAEYSPNKIDTEVAYNYFSPFYVSIVLYIATFLLTIVSWIGFRLPLNRAAFWLLNFSLCIHVGGLVARVAISGRPPITNLYSSFVFVAAGCVLLLMLVERVTKFGVGNLLGAIAGFSSLLYAWTLSINQGDTFTVLRAVLDTQFWLTTHVIIINWGYIATLVAGLMGVAMLLLLAVANEEAGFGKSVRKTFTNIIYGIVCFALLFSFFGTVLGGLWADDSWGRFWGWDPKENGALMIVLWNAVILHARWAGLVKERGIAALAAFGNVIVIWSWEGVNQLQVGLHAYADSSGGSAVDYSMLFLKGFVLFNFLVAALALVVPKSWYRCYATNDKLNQS